MKSRGRDVHAPALSCALLLAAGSSSCIIRGDDCGANQVATTGYLAVCICAPDHVTTADGSGCVPCGENETTSSDRCVCRPGFARPSAGEACAPTEGPQACESDATCPGTEPYCARPGDAPGYCTRAGCTVNADCTFGWSCEQGTRGRYCARPPSGLGSSCESSADCATFDARYCDTLLSHACLLAGCANRESTCPNEWACCDYSTLLGMPLSICIDPTRLTQGACPQGGTKVTF